MRKYTAVLFGVVLGIALVAVPGCTGNIKTDAANARKAVHNFASKALGLVTAAIKNPKLVENAKIAAVDVVNAVDPKDAATAKAIVDHINAGNLDKAQDLLAPLVAASADPPDATAPTPAPAGK